MTQKDAEGGIAQNATEELGRVAHNPGNSQLRINLVFLPNTCHI